MDAAVSPRPGTQFSFGHQCRQSRFHIRGVLRNLLFEQPPLHNPSQCVLSRWIRLQVIQNLPFNFRFTLQYQNKFSYMGMLKSIGCAVQTCRLFGQRCNLLLT